KWFPYNKGGAKRRWYGNQELVVNWEDDGKELKAFKGAVIRNPSYYFKPCISWGLISGPLFRYFPNGFIYDVQGMSCFYKSDEQLQKEIVWQNTKVFNEVAKIISPAGHIQIGEIGKMPCCDNAPEGIEEVGKQNISISKQDWDSHETSWDFQRNPLLEQLDLLKPLEVLVENYKSEWEDHFHTLHRNEEELNRKFIEIYGLQDELTPDVPLDEITILQKGEISIEDNKIVWHNDVIIKQFISYLVGCMMGRYSVDRPGLIIASQGQKVADLDLPTHTIEIDDDGIIPVIMEEDFFADDLTQRIETAVKKLFGERNFYENMKFIKVALGMNLRDYLYKNYYADHQQMYSVKGAKRPIYWLFSSQMGEKKKKGHFKALVYMHRLESDTLSKLHADYVHPYLTKVEQQLREAEDDATRDDLSQAQHNKALKQAEELKEKVREVKAFETQLVEMASARITIDLDDGVKVNYPKFYPLVEPIKGLDTKDE
ncbi:MAG: BREX-1 system adenine-specific DNA-methyltransferase PglX, partial [Bacteroidaceae bacterium]|nr:BREX-1 system adenine-specific DNA-methyltransferase PglX [Bacteroidaceae bacterium]